MRYYLVAGEASGDLHGSNLMKEIIARDPQADIRFWGGDLMQAVGGTLVSHYKERAFMGLWEVIKNLRTIAGFLQQAKQDIIQWKADAIILIDNPGFNMRLAKFGKEAGYPIHYYIAPKVWAWNTKRVVKIKKYVDYLYCILPFEPDFFSKHGVKIDYVGNPIVDAISQFKPEANWKENRSITKPIVAILPGSRRYEIENTLPILASLQPDFPDHTFVVAGATGFDPLWLQGLAANEEVKICINDTYNILANAQVGMIASGTATLETAAFNVPQLVCYRVAAFTYFIGKKLMKVPWASLVNLILWRELVPEFIQDDFTRENVKKELAALLQGPKRDQMFEGYKELNERLGPVGASAKTAELMVGRIKNLRSS